MSEGAEGVCVRRGQPGGQRGNCVVGQGTEQRGATRWEGVRVRGGSWAGKGTIRQVSVLFAGLFHNVFELPTESSASKSFSCWKPVI